VFEDDRRSPGLFLDDEAFAPAFEDRVADREDGDGADDDLGDADLGAHDLGVSNDVGAEPVIETLSDTTRDAPIVDDTADLPMALTPLDASDWVTTPVFDTGEETDAAAFHATLDADVGVTDDRLTRIDPVPDGSRIAATIQRLVQVGDDAHTAGRLAFTAGEREAHARFAALLKEAGFSARTDAFGNTIGERPGASDRPFITLGGHLDAAPSSGGDDDLVGAVGALEVGQMIRESGIVTQHPLRIVAFAGHDSTRFGESCLGSRAVAGQIDAGDVERLHDVDGRSLAQALSDLGFDAGRVESVRWRTGEVAAYLELDVDRGPLGPAGGTPLGVVDTVLGHTQVRVTVRGRAGHAGSTAMDARRDALAGAAEMVLEVERAANQPGRRYAVATVGALDVSPDAVTSIPEVVTFSVDVRDLDGSRQRADVGALLVRFAQIAHRRGLTLAHQTIADRSPTVLSHWLRCLAQQTCIDIGLPHRVAVSGASHDGQIMARSGPAGVLLLPGCQRSGQTPLVVDAVAAGVRALSRCLMRLDRFLTDEVG
jgi:allantoate deiminase